jgi:ketosteroid isomerase-like protein
MNIKARGIVVDEVWSRLYQLRDGRIIRVKTFTNPVAASEEAAATPS